MKPVVSSAIITPRPEHQLRNTMTGEAKILSAEAGAYAAPSMTHWDRVAEETTWGRYVADIEKRVILQAESVAEKPGAALDIGCGGGRWTKMLSERGWRMTSTEINAEAL